jgi:hypothetical protein
MQLMYDRPTLAPATVVSAGNLKVLEHAITVDTGIDSHPLSPVDVEAFRRFALQNPLARSIEPIGIPDEVARLGTNLYFGNEIFQAPYTSEQLRARYGNHAGYVGVYRQATSALVHYRLWDPTLGAVYLNQAADSSVLR